MINVTNVVEEFRRADLQVYIDEYTLGDLQFKTFFPSLYTPSLTFEGLQAAFGAKVAADVVAMDSRAPRKGRPTIGKVTGDIPKIEVARVKKESDLNVYRQLLDAANRASGGSQPQVRKRLIDWMYEDATFALDAVNARMEWLAKRIASNGKYSLNLTNNEGGIVTKVDIDFAIPNANRISASANWFAVNANPTSYKPITDIKTVTQTARAKGIKLLYMTMDQELFDKVAMADEVQKFCAGFVNNVLNLQQTPNLETVNTALRNAGLPTIRIWDSFVQVEAKAGTQTTVSGWEQGNISFTIAPTFGDSQWTDTADNFVNLDKDSTKAQNDFVLVKAFATQDPISVVTKGIAYATPVLNNSNGTYILKTKTA